MPNIISFPHLGDYSIPIKLYLEKITNCKVQTAPPITKKTLDIGTKYSPNTVCIPFKYNLGNFIESLNEGANILITAGGGCRYNYYAEVTENILKDLNYDFTMYKLISKDSLKFTEVYHMFKTINKKLTKRKFIYDSIYTFFYIWQMDKIDKIIRKNIGFEITKNNHLHLKEKMYKDFSSTNKISKLIKLYFKYKKLFKHIKLNKPKKVLRIGIIGELYTSMEPFSNYNLEKELATMNIEIKRYTNLSYLLWQKRFLTKHMLRIAKKYCKYSLGADGLDNVYRTIMLSKKKYDGIIHIKPFGCTPEIGAIPIIKKAATIPIIFFSYDSETESEGIKTRLEAFYDLITLRRKKHEKSISRN